MTGQNIKLQSSDGGLFDCYASLPAINDQVPAIVIACAVYGVDADVRRIADEFAANGYIAYAPDLFWRTVPGALKRGDRRTQERAQPRYEKINTGERDMLDVAAAIRNLPQSNGSIAAIGLCYGGPYAIIAPKRLGYDAGISCHGSQMWSYVDDLDGVTSPVCLIWGEKDHAATPEVQKIYPELSKVMKNVEVHLLPDVLHGYMNILDTVAFDQAAHDFSMQRSLTILAALRS